MDTERKTERLAIRITKSDKARLEKLAEAQKMNLSDAVVNAALALAAKLGL